MSEQERDPFNDDALRRLMRSEADYQRSHGHYIVPLAQRLLNARAELERVEAVRDEWMAASNRDFNERRLAKAALAREREKVAALGKVVAAFQALREVHYHYGQGAAELDSDAVEQADEAAWDVLSEYEAEWVSL